MGVLWHKVWFDLWHNKTRTFLAVLSIAAGVFAIGAIFGMSDMLNTAMDQSHRAVLPPHIDISLTTPVDRDILIHLKDVPGVEDVEPYNAVRVLYKLYPQDEWRRGIVHMRGDFDTQKYQLVQLKGGHWPDNKNEIGVERMTAQFYRIGIGDTIIFKIGDKERRLPITGLIRHPFVPPPVFEDLASFFMNGEGLERLDFPEGKFSACYVRVTPYSSDQSREVATAIKDKLAKQNISISSFRYQDPDEHWARSLMDGFVLVQQVLAVLSVLMSTMLVYNTLSNLITQQTDQIGILKAIGGRNQTIIGVYLIGALVYGVLSLAIALPMGGIVAFGVAHTFLSWFNIDLNQFQVSSQAVIFQILAALAVPLLAGLPPALHGANITVRQAIASYGLGGDFRSGRLDRLVEGFGQRWMPSYYATALGNMFRQGGRLLLTQVVLVTAGSAFLMVMSLNSSIDLTLENVYARQRFNTMIKFSANQRASRVMAMANSVPGVKQAELHLLQSASLFVEGQLVKEAGLSTEIRGIPSASDFFRPLIVAGRWIMPGENGRVVVLPREKAEDNHIQVGDTVTLNLGESGKDEWLVIGLYDPVFAGFLSQDIIFAPLEALYQTTKKYNQGSLLYLRTTSHGDEFTAAVTAQLKDMYEGRGMKVYDSATQAEQRKTDDSRLGIAISMMLSLSIIVAIVGGIALMGALSIGVIERTKEIGVLRAVGARSRAILGIFVLEGVFQGLLGWLIAIPVSYLVGPAAAHVVGQTMFDTKLDYQYNWPAVAMWLGIVLLISTIASIIPARGATRISVRDSLAYT
jgi:putative ABC transport system permease protein